ncbi:MAG: Mov34/MPN/PAD-1 family protein [Candidatus Pacearchaeota archaeon]|nr:Mov34/MPN/PAD-1 family protein [Candidatus Pacearchaeota archaeon]
MRNIEKRIRLQKEAFQIIVLSAIEVYKKEMIGDLFGREETNKGKLDYIVELACPYQSAERRYSEAEINIKKLGFNGAPENLELKLIGDYHSHTDYGQGKKRTTPYPSEEDINWLKENKNAISIIAAIKKSKKWKSGWNLEKERNSLIGVIRGKNGDVLNINIKGFCYDSFTGKPRSLEIIPSEQLQIFLKSNKLR